jgi:hypothetical protein
VPTAEPLVIVLDDLVHGTDRDIENTRGLYTATSKAVENLPAGLIAQVKLEAVLATISTLGVEGSMIEVR